MITIYDEKNDTYVIDPDGWDYPVSEVPYLIESREDANLSDVFILKDGRLYEAIRK